MCRKQKYLININVMPDLKIENIFGEMFIQHAKKTFNL